MTPHWFDASSDDDALTWLGFQPVEPERPRPSRAWRTTWPAPRRAGRHRSPARPRKA